MHSCEQIRNSKQQYIFQHVCSITICLLQSPIRVRKYYKLIVKFASIYFILNLIIHKCEHPRFKFPNNDFQHWLASRHLRSQWSLSHLINAAQQGETGRPCVGCTFNYVAFAATCSLLFHTNEKQRSAASRPYKYVSVCPETRTYAGRIDNEGIGWLEYSITKRF